MECIEVRPVTTGLHLPLLVFSGLWKGLAALGVVQGTRTCLSSGSPCPLRETALVWCGVPVSTILSASMRETAVTLSCFCSNQDLLLTLNPPAFIRVYLRSSVVP